MRNVKKGDKIKIINSVGTKYICKNQYYTVENIGFDSSFYLDISGFFLDDLGELESHISTLEKWHPSNENNFVIINDTTSTAV